MTQPRTLTPDERLRALSVFDGLGASTITVNNQTSTFGMFYQRHVEEKHAAPFFDQLLNANDPAGVGKRLLGERWRQIVSDLRAVGVRLAGEVGEQCLVAFCGYWWQSFGKGYIREIEVFRDLERSGIDFVAHDLRDPNQRFSRHDLVVLGFFGDIKTSTYFLHAARSFPLTNDFYIVRIYDVLQRRWLDIVMVKLSMWRVINGDTTLCELDEVPQSLPTPLRLVTRGEVLVVITYEDWKQRILRVQQTRQEDRQ